MNYHHAFHAGNHAEVFKHAALVKLLLRMKQKSTPMFFIDTHSGAGLTNLQGEQSLRTGEASLGILKLLGKSNVAAQPYVDIVRSYNEGEVTRYPGSAAIVRAMLSGSDRLVACELRDSAYRDLKHLFKGDKMVSVHHRDGYETMQALVPPRERRGVVFIDPPFEDKEETNRLSREMAKALLKWPTGVFAVWYPIKDRFAGRPLVNAMLGVGAAKVLSVEFVPFPSETRRLAGSGLLFCNAPWRLDDDLRELCGELLVSLGATSGRWAVAWAPADSRA